MLAPAIVPPPKLAWHPAQRLDLPSHEPTLVGYETTMLEEQVNRKVYPYSIVPGGAENLLQAKRAMTDPAIKDHYADVNLSQLKEVKLATNLSGYVSYRWGEKIYWTSKPITLRAGETVFTDGQHIVRGRCLNSYSARRMLPIRPSEPTEKILDAPIEMPVMVYSFPKLPLFAPELPMPPEELTPGVPALAPAVLPTLAKVATKGGFHWFPIIPIIPPIHHHHPRSPSTPGSPISPTSPLVPPIVPPVAVVPEARYGWALLAGLFAIGLALRRLRDGWAAKSN
jgi:hypothetical protein